MITDDTLPALFPFYSHLDILASFFQTNHYKKEYFDNLTLTYSSLLLFPNSAIKLYETVHKITSTNKKEETSVKFLLSSSFDMQTVYFTIPILEPYRTVF